MSDKTTFLDMIANVEHFHNSFKIENNYSPTIDIDMEEILLRYKLMREENEEYLDAAVKMDIVEVADALGDQLYILCGTILKHGLQHKIVEIFEEIQASNMSKLDGNGRPIRREDGKILKSHYYTEPDIKSILEEH